jgi:hypothetical protein
MADDESDYNGVVNALFVAAGAATLVFVGMIAFSPEQLGRHGTPVPQQAAEFQNLDDEDSSPSPGPREGEEGEEGEEEQRRSQNSMNRNERARALGRWNR